MKFKKLINSLLYCGAMVSLTSTNVYAIMPKGYDFEKQETQNRMIVDWLSIIINLAIIYIICMIIYCIKAKKTIRKKIKKVIIFSIITAIILFLLFWGGSYIIDKTDLYKYFL